MTIAGLNIRTIKNEGEDLFMFQNLKVDIIYYSTNTDFEMEFNLCGCCRMRLLTDKASDKKTFVHELARAVSRSRVIIIAGELFGSNGIIEIASHAIGKPLADIDNKQFGISGDKQIKVINGATPLVTGDGIFGGCIIESGPQTMIFLSENRQIRKAIMNTLIHPYIEELCAIELKSKADSVNRQTYEMPIIEAPSAVPQAEIEELPVVAESDISSSSEEITDEIETPQSDAVQDEATEEAEEFLTGEEEEETAVPLNSFSQQTADNGEIELSGGMIYEEDGKSYNESIKSYADNEDSTELYMEPQRIKKNDAEYYNSLYAIGSDENSDYKTDTDNYGGRRPIFYGNLGILITAIILLVVLAVLAYCIFYVPAKNGISASAYIKETFDTLLGR